MAMSAAETSAAPSPMVFHYEELTIPAPAEGPPTQAISVTDLTPRLAALIKARGLRHGFVNLISLHTTTAVTINEHEERLMEDLKEWLAVDARDHRSVSGIPLRAVAYKHNDIDARPASAAERRRCLDNGWDVDDPKVLAAWRAQEPINAHAHLLSMLLGNSETIPIADGRMVLGQWQSVLLVDLDGPRTRRVGVQLIG